MKRTFLTLLLAAAIVASAETLARFDPRAGLRTLDIPADWPVELQAAQREIAAASGYLPLVVSNAPAATAFTEPVRVVTTNEAGVLVYYVDAPVAIPLDRGKLLAAVTAGGALSNAVSALSSDARLGEWWASNLTYVRGSTNAVLMATALGLDQPTLEALVLACKSDDAVVPE